MSGKFLGFMDAVEPKETVPNELYTALRTLGLTVPSGMNSFFNGGVFIKSGMKFSDVDRKQLDLGVRVELEHTDNKAIALKIALDHLAEDPEYYTKLARMEGAAKSEPVAEAVEEDEVEDGRDYSDVATPTFNFKELDIDVSNNKDRIIISMHNESEEEYTEDDLEEWFLDIKDVLHYFVKILENEGLLTGYHRIVAGVKATESYPVIFGFIENESIKTKHSEIKKFLEGVSSSNRRNWMIY